MNPEFLEMLRRELLRLFSVGGPTNPEAVRAGVNAIGGGRLPSRSVPIKRGERTAKNVAMNRARGRTGVGIEQGPIEQVAPFRMLERGESRVERGVVPGIRHMVLERLR